MKSKAGHSFSGRLILTYIIRQGMSVRLTTIRRTPTMLVRIMTYITLLIISRIPSSWVYVFIKAKTLMCPRTSWSYSQSWG